MSARGRRVRRRSYVRRLEKTRHWGIIFNPEDDGTFPTPPWADDDDPGSVLYAACGGGPTKKGENDDGGAG